MKTINIKTETINIIHKSIKINSEIIQEKPTVEIHPDIQKRYDNFNDWLSSILNEHQINPSKHEEFIKEIITLYMWELDTDQKRKEIENLILNNPNIKKDIRSQKIKKINKSNE